MTRCEHAAVPLPRTISIYLALQNADPAGSMLKIQSAPVRIKVSVLDTGRVYV